MYYQMLRAVELTYLNNQGLIQQFFFNFTLIMQSISCLFALFGTSYFQRRFGLKGCLILFPLLLGLGVLVYLISPTLITITVVMIIAKGINYVLYQPAKEMLYIPTTRAIKYKSKAWIDMFGLRSAKVGGSIINKSIGIASRLTGGVALVLVFLWIFLSRSIGTRYNKVIKKGERVGS